MVDQPQYPNTSNADAHGRVEQTYSIVERPIFLSNVPDRVLPSIQGLIDSFLTRRSPQTRKAYQTDLQDFALYLGVSSNEEALQSLVSQTQGYANSMVLAYKNNLIERKLSPNTVNRKLATLRSAVKLANTLGIVAWTIEIQNEKVQAYRDTRGVGTDGFRIMLGAVDKYRNRTKAVRDRAILRLMYSMALRRGEVSSLDLSDYSPQDHKLMVKGKGRTEKESMTVPDGTAQALDGWIEVRGNQPGALFINLDRAGKGSRLTGTGIYYIVKALGKAVGITARPHGLRHAGITEALDRSNGDYRKVRKFSRHKNIETVAVYDDSRQDFAGEIAQIVDGSI